MHEREFEGVKDTKTISPYFLYHTGCLFFSERELVPLLLCRYDTYCDN